jgi:hypothetical protein
VGDRRAHECDFEQPKAVNIADELTAAMSKASIFLAAQRCADAPA